MRVKQLLFAITFTGGVFAHYFAVAKADPPAKDPNSLAVLCPASLSDAARMQCLENLDTVLEEEIKVSTAQKKLDEDTGDDQLSDKARGITVPNVLSIYGFGAQPLSAVLAYSGDRSLTVHTGEDVPGGFHVDNIYASPPKVVLSKDAKQYVLLMGNGGPSINANGDPNAPQTAPMTAVDLPPSQPVPVYPPSAPMPAPGQ
jgi:hypothetical protein